MQNQTVRREVEKILEDAMKRITQVMTGVVPLRETSPNKKLEQLVTGVLSEAESALTVNDIAQQIGAPVASVRGILYANQDRFEKIAISPARMKWKIGKEIERQVTCDSACEFAGAST